MVERALDHGSYVRALPLLLKPDTFPTSTMTQLDTMLGLPVDIVEPFVQPLPHEQWD